MKLVLHWLKWLFSSKKRTAAVIAVLFAIFHPLLAKVGIDVAESHVAMVVTVISAFILGQGVADMGKEAKALELSAPPKKKK